MREHGNKNKKPIARDKVVQAIQETTREKWKQEKGYHVRSLVETAMYRFKTIFGGKLLARTLDSQIVNPIVKYVQLLQLASKAAGTSRANVRNLAKELLAKSVEAEVARLLERTV
ncbi:MAG: hypothetical protein P8104_01480 [Gammaproteobacteria bacterium]